MQIIIDTSNQDLFVALISKQKTLRYQHIKNIKRKADNLPTIFQEITKNITPQEIEAFYITIGPGSFTGARVGLVFVRSIAQITGAKIFTTTSLQLIAGPKGLKEVFVDARSNLSYYGLIKDGQLAAEIKLVPFVVNQTFTNYLKMIEKPREYMDLFTERKNLLEIHPVYIKEPRIGG